MKKVKQPGIRGGLHVDRIGNLSLLESLKGGRLLGDFVEITLRSQMLNDREMFCNLAERINFSLKSWMAFKFVFCCCNKHHKTSKQTKTGKGVYLTFTSRSH